MQRKSHRNIAVRRCGDLLVLLACAVLESARFNAQSLSVPAGVLTGGVILATFSLRRLLARHECSRPAPKGGGIDDDKHPGWFMACLLLFTVIPSAAEWAMQTWLGLGQAYEFHLCVWLRNFMLATMATSFYRGHLRLAGLLSLFVVVFASAMAEDRWTWTLTAAYCFVGAWWLAILYWSGLKGHFATESRRRIPSVLKRRRLMLSLGAAIAAILLMLVPALSGTALFGASATTAIAGWFGTSGGTGDYDPFARAGLNDGDALVNGTEDAASVGPVESDVFLSSDEASLYDVFNDMYGEPRKLKKLERAVALDNPRTSPKQEQKWAESRKISREFSTLRNRPPKSKQKKLNDQNSPALLYIAGRTPLHLRVQTFETFDGTTWTCRPDPVEQQRKPPLCVQSENKKPWISMGLAAVFSQPTHTDLHVIKIVHLDTNHIPAPPRLARLHIDKIDRADFFAWAEGDVIQMTREKIPPLTVVRMVSQLPSAEQLRELHRQPVDCLPKQPDALLAVPQNDRTAEITQLAKRWAGDAKPGWEQVSAVVTHLRQEFEYAPDAVVPTGCDDSGAHFLFDSRQGPDYSFASASAVILRHLGYPTRVVSGFYASPDSYDSRSRHTPVLARDVHFWAEVELGSGCWATVEATPGYEVLSPPVTIAQQCLAMLRAVWLWCWQNATSLAVGCIGLVILFCHRRPILDRALQCLWTITAARSADACIWATIYLLDCRSHWAGCPRPTFITPTHWYGVIIDGNATQSMQQRFAAMADWCFYAPVSVKQHPPAWTTQEVRDVCRWTVQYWSLRQCRARLCLSRKTINSESYSCRRPLK